ncbi:MAG TPA: response regulator transcription factor [Candidatus Copromorpha excrementipullorum]|uniref:Stage 0 sporulation protein A homolog n=1 Tax=Candidatus Allocopromorpha excrementipullorum TaxID=2840743 RepID=A0A9D1N5U1_9FIRM|nr:response regulator transcription factor [Candidatus Copromorpha excrementipullorum]
MEGKNKGGILLVEDDRSLNRAVSLKLAKEGYDVYPAEDLKTGWQLYCDNDIALIICDIGLPDGSGLDFCARVRAADEITGEGLAGSTEPARSGGCVFLFLTAMDTETDIVNGYDVGGDDYVTKPFSLAVLISKVNAIMSRYGQMVGEGRGPAATGNGGSSSGNGRAEGSSSGNGWADGIGGGTGQRGIRSGDIVFDSDRNMVTKDGKHLQLTANEQKLLLYFLDNPMKVLSKTQLLEAIWDIDGNFVDDNTVAVNIRRLREKIEEDPSKPAVIKNIRGLGYIWERECEKL